MFGSPGLYGLASGRFREVGRPNAFHQRDKAANGFPNPGRLLLALVSGTFVGCRLPKLEQRSNTPCVFKLNEALVPVVGMSA